MAKKIVAVATQLTPVAANSKGVMYNTTLRAGDLIDLTRFMVDRYNPALHGEPENGYQRPEDGTRARKIARYLARERTSSFPQSLTVSCRGSVTYDAKNNQITLGESANEFPFFIIDGQHRVAGMRIAIEEMNVDIRDLQFPVTVLSGFSKVDEIKQFLDINTEHKGVATGLALEQLGVLAGDETRREAMEEDNKFWKVQALQVAHALNEDTNSSWYQRVQKPNEEKNPSHTTKSTSLIGSMSPILGRNATMSGYLKDKDSRTTLVKAYWNILAEIWPDAFKNPEEYVIQRTPGMYTLHILLADIISHFGAANVNEYTLRLILTAMFNNSDKFTTDYWRRDARDGASQYGSFKGFKYLANEFKELLLETATSTSKDLVKA